MGQLTPYLKSGLTAASTFNSGSLRAILSRGIIRIQRWTMSASFLQLLIEGTVTTDGRLDLEVNGTPGGLGTDRGLVRRVPVVGATSAAILAEATNFLGSRLIHLRVGGTLRNPNIRYAPQFALTEQALQFFNLGK